MQRRGLTTEDSEDTEVNQNPNQIQLNFVFLRVLCVLKRGAAERVVNLAFLRVLRAFAVKSNLLRYVATDSSSGLCFHFGDWPKNLHGLL